jgi:hypothetical protein
MKNKTYQVKRDGYAVSDLIHNTKEEADKEAEMWYRIKERFDPTTKIEIKEHE